MHTLATLPTAGAGLGIGSMIMAQSTFLAGPLALVAAGAILVRSRFRRGRSIND